MEIDTVSIQEQRDKMNVLILKISTAQKEILSIKDRKDRLENAYYVDGEMSEGKFKKMLDNLRFKKIQTESLISNYNAEIGNIKKVIKQIELPTNIRYAQSLLSSDLDKDRSKIKEIMFDNINNITVKRLMKGNHKCVEITINSKSNISFIFVYDTWLNTHRKSECNVFYEGLPVYNIDGGLIKLNGVVMDSLYSKIGLPLLTDSELGKAIINSL